MIAKRIDRKPEVKDDYSALGRYIAAAKEKGEKLDKFWISNCGAGSDLADLDLALIEIEATRSLKSGLNDRTYHLVVSFRPDDREKLSADALKDIERTLAEALGYGDHQRIAGTHINTDNFHLHIAFNKIHPETLRCHTPLRDFHTLSKTCRALELKYGLAIDKGIEPDIDKGLSGKARDYEARTWQQSFESHLREHKDAILSTIADATSWRALHDGLAQYDTMLKKRGAGLAFTQVGGKGAVKASALDRSCSLKSLEERLGPYLPPQERAQATPGRPRRPYVAKPLTHHPATDRLWRTYRQQKSAGFLPRHFHVRNWKDYLLADAHKDPLALAIILTYKELFYQLDQATTIRASFQPSKISKPALEHWYAASSWKAPALPLHKGALDVMDLRADEQGRVLIPFRDAKGYIMAVRAIDGAGRTVDIGDITVGQGLRHVIDPGGVLKGKAYTGQIVLAADPIIAMAIHRDTHLPVIVVPTEDGLGRAGRELRNRHQVNPIIVAASHHSQAATTVAAQIGGTVRVADADQVLATWVANQVGRGKSVAVDPVLAHAMGAFVDNALPLEDALASVAPETKGQGNAVNPGQAHAMGAFVEDALSATEAKDSQLERGKTARKGEDGLGR